VNFMQHNYTLQHYEPQYLTVAQLQLSIYGDCGQITGVSDWFCASHNRQETLASVIHGQIPFTVCATLLRYFYLCLFRQFFVCLPCITVVSDVLYMHRTFLSGTGGPAQWPDASRLVEAICVRLCAMYPAAKKRSKTARVHEPRWNSILAAYKQIRDVVISNRRLMDNTGLQLFDLNTRTLTQWFVVISQ